MNNGRHLLEAIDERGEIGFLDSTLTPQTGAAGEKSLMVHLGDGSTAFAEAKLFAETQPGMLRYSGTFASLKREPADHQTRFDDSQSNSNQQNLAAIDARTNERGEIVVPLIAEEIKIGKRTVETGGVRVHKTVREDVQRINEPIVREHLDVERVEINQFVETAPAIRYEGDVMIVPVLEEVVVTQKRLLLREEIRLTKRREEIADSQEVTLRREEISLEKIRTENIEPGMPER